MEFCGPSRSGRWPCRSSTGSCPDHDTNGLVRDRNPKPKESSMKRILLLATVLWISLFWAQPARSFCGFYVAQGNAKLFNHASKVVMVRDADRTVLTMANDYSGEPAQFAIVIPVPTVLQRGQIHVGDRAVMEHLDAYSAPRIVEYFDPDPCMRYEALQSAPMSQGMARKSADSRNSARERSLGVRIEARYTVGEYDILILSAKQSGGLETWLLENGYSGPAGARPGLAGYNRPGMEVFCSDVELGGYTSVGLSFPRSMHT